MRTEYSVGGALSLQRSNFERCTSLESAAVRGPHPLAACVRSFFVSSTFPHGHPVRSDHRRSRLMSASYRGAARSLGEHAGTLVEGACGIGRLLEAEGRRALVEYFDRPGENG